MKKGLWMQKCPSETPGGFLEKKPFPRKTPQTEIP
tara:strand:+ start:270 stop:374 length:105 start_codon:yes stop_codon:yes gene_type:complete